MYRCSRLLAEAGYPEGFKTEILIPTTDADLIAIVKAQWADVGIDLEIVAQEPATYSALSTRKEWDYLVASSKNSPGPICTMKNMHTGDYWNWGNFSDAHIDKTIDAIVFGADYDLSRLETDLRELGVYYLDQAYEIALPSPAYFNYW